MLVATNIQWATHNTNMPTQIIIPIDIDKDTASIRDYISNTVGACRKFELRRLKDIYR